jgi:3-hydroxybutyryl-CoA dehydrogenase
MIRSHVRAVKPFLWRTGGFWGFENERRGMVQSIAVIGAGTMGAGIAQLAAMQGCAVCLLDVQAEFVQRGIENIKRNLNRSVEKGKLSEADRDAVLNRVTYADTTALGGIAPTGSPLTLAPLPAMEKRCLLPDVELAIEAVIEDLDTKRKVFQQLEQATAAGTVLATNTSSLSVSKIAEAVRDPSRVVGMHFFNPVAVMPLVEIVAGRQSDPAAVDLAFTTSVAWGKTAVRAKDTPGFIVNRVARGYYLEALRLLGEGVAGIDEIDQVMRVHGGFRMGPFELMDLVGLDVNLAVSTSVWEQMDHHPRFAPHEIQRRLVAAGHLGRKTARGFYAYSEDGALPAVPVDRRSFQLSPLLSGAVQAFAERGGARQAGGAEQYVFARMLAAILNEAALAFDAGVASREDIDTAMRLGTNYPKGPMAWIDEIGSRTVRGLLRRLNESAGDGRYEPAPLFAE